jgi:DNA-binding CsgD family transcriptional regulator
MSEEVLQRLDVLIRLQAAALTMTIESSKEKILFLSNAGLRPTLIADILGTTTNTVNVTLSKSRKPSKSK